MRRDINERFWEKVDKFGGCWVWTAAKTRGYGTFQTGDGTVAAHLFAYRSLVGPVPDGLQLDHLCRNRACVNPAHLEPVTAGENIRRSPLRGGLWRKRITHCPQGHPYDEANTYVNAGRRSCRACRRERARARRAA